MARRDIEFDAEGVTLRGWFYPADGASGDRPRRSSWRTASRPSRRCTSTSTPRCSPRPGSNALVFDNRNFGASDGEPRQEIDPWAQVRDYRHAITYADHAARGRRRPDRRLGQQLLRRARAGRRRHRPPGQGRGLPGAAGQRARQLPRAGPRRTSSPASGRCSTPTALARFRRRGARRWCRWSTRTRWPRRRCPRRTPTQWFTETHDLRAPSWRNEVTLRSVEMFTEYEPVAYIALHQPDAAADAARAERRAHPDRPGHRRLREGARAEEAGDPAGRALRRLRRRLRRTRLRPPATGSCSTSGAMH